MRSHTRRVGLVTGINIKDTVDKLIALQGKPRDAATARQAALKSQQTSVAELLALTLGVQIAGKKFTDTSLYTKKDVTSSKCFPLLPATFLCHLPRKMPDLRWQRSAGRPVCRVLKKYPGK